MKKNIILLVSLFLITITALGNNINELYQVQTQSIAEQVYERLEVSRKLPQFTNNYIDKVSQNRSDVTVSLWRSIKNSIDYSSYKSSAVQILTDNYSSTELQSLLNEYSDKPFIPIEYIGVRNRLFEAIEQFNTNMISQINTILVSNNRTRINVN